MKLHFYESNETISASVKIWAILILNNFDDACLKQSTNS